VIVNRKGHVEHVLLGDAHKLELPDLGRHRAGRGRLRGVRLLHTHLQSEPLTKDDLTDLALLRLDYVAALEVTKEGAPGQWYGAHVTTQADADVPWVLLDPEPAHTALFLNFERFLKDLETELARQTRLEVVDERPRVTLVQVAEQGKDADCEASLQELRELAATAGVNVVDELLQRRAKVDPRTVLGRGKLQDLALSTMTKQVDLAVFDHNLTATQVRSISEASDLKIIDRTQLILDIFAQRARTREGKQQVELAQLKYRLPRLSRQHTAFSRLAGGIGGRGPGEQKLEVDRRRVKDRITLLTKELGRVAKSREIRRRKRNRQQVPIVSIVGYTNAGKSTLLNTLTSSKVLAENKLFATLDPTSRRLRFPQEREIVITDTVGFIRELPPDLVMAFRATLEELRDADLLLHVVDVSSPYAEQHLEAVDNLLHELELDDRPVLRVLNKVDRLPAPSDAAVMAARLDGIPVSALKPKSLAPLLERIERLMWQEHGRSMDLNLGAITDKSDPTTAFWSARWDENQTPWDIGEPHPELLARSEELGPPGRAYVPGCGRGHDAAALAGAGWAVTAVDLVHHMRDSLHPRLIHSGGRFVQGDAFGVDVGGDYDLWFDHTFFCAIPPDQRDKWGSRARELIKVGGHVATIVFPMVPLREAGPPFVMTAADVSAALGPKFELIVEEDAERPSTRQPLEHRYAVFERTGL